MFGTRIRKLVLALSLFAAVGSLLPGSHAASAAPIVAPPGEDVHISMIGAADPADDQRNTIILPPWKIDYLGVVKNGTQTHYKFKLAVRRGTKPHVVLERFVGYKYVSNDEPAGDQDQGPVYIGTLTAPYASYPTIICNPPAGQYCSSAILKATSTDGTSVIRATGDDGNKS